MSAAEFADWKTWYYEIQQFGPHYQDRLFALQTAHIVGCLAQDAPRDLNSFMLIQEDENEPRPDRVMAALEVMKAHAQRK